MTLSLIKWWTFLSIYYLPENKAAVGSTKIFIQVSDIEQCRRYRDEKNTFPGLVGLKIQ